MKLKSEKNIPMIIESEMASTSSDISRIETLLKMQERAEERKAKRSFTRDFLKAKQSMKPVFRSKVNQQTKSTYADLEAISNVIDPTMFQHGFILSYSTQDCPKDNHYRVAAELSHKDGISKNYYADIPIDGAGNNKTKCMNDTQCFGSTISYGRRYLKCMIWDIALTDDDGNSAAKVKTISQAQIQKLQELIQETDTDLTIFCKLTKIESLAQMPDCKYKIAEDLLFTKKRQMGAGND